MFEKDQMIKATITISEKILITFVLFYYIFNTCISIFYLKFLCFYFYFISLFYYFKCLRNCNDFDYNNTENNSNFNITDNSFLKSLCNDCNSLQFMNTKHCKICNICIKNNYFHCMFINNCINDRNSNDYLFFLIFLIISNFLSNFYFNYFISLICMFFVSLHFIKRIKRKRKMNLLINFDQNNFNKSIKYEEIMLLLRKEMSDIEWEYVLWPFMKREVQIIE